jgi:small-conductance mechanosensitive channel
MVKRHQGKSKEKIKLETASISKDSLSNAPKRYFLEKLAEEESRKKNIETKSTKIALTLFEGILKHGRHGTSSQESPPLSPSESCIKEEHIKPFFNDADYARRAFLVFDKDQNGDITFDELRETIKAIYQERKAIGKSLRDSSCVIRTLERILVMIVLIVTVLIGFAIFQSFALSSLVPLGSILLAMSFIFGQSARDTFESFVFIFVVHPFDTGIAVVCV